MIVGLNTGKKAERQQTWIFYVLLLVFIVWKVSC
jgi:hypothetical protein